MSEIVTEPSPFALHKVAESVLFASQKPVAVKEFLAILKGAAEAAKDTNPVVAAHGKVKESELREAIEVLQAEYDATGRTFEVRESASGWQLVTRANYAPWLRQLFPENRPSRLSAPSMETLAIIAYRQPITRADIEAVRGVAVDGVMQTLLDKGLVRIAGRAEVPGRPLLYETTRNFMEHFGLKNLDELPNADELRRINLPQAVPAAPPASEAPASTAESSSEQGTVADVTPDEPAGDTIPTDERP